MRNFLLTTALTIAAAASCGRLDNPKVEKFAATDFEIAITETRQFHDFHYTCDRGSRTLSIDPAEQKLQELWITGWNEVTMTLKGLDASFEGANVSSSDPGVVKVEKKDSRTFTLGYVADGTSTITVWTSDLYSYSFKVFAKDVIDIEYITMKIKDANGEFEYKMKIREYFRAAAFGSNGGDHFKKMGYADDTCHVRLRTQYLRLREDYASVRIDKYIYGLPGISKYCEPDKDLLFIEVGEIYPENSSWRNVNIFHYSNYYSDPEATAEVLLGMPKFINHDVTNQWSRRRCPMESNLDWTDVKGRKAVYYEHPFALDASYATYEFAVEIFTRYGAKQPDREKARQMFAYLLCDMTQECDYPPTDENPINQRYLETGNPWPWGWEDQIYRDPVKYDI